MIDVVDFNTGMVLKEQASSRAEAIEWINSNFNDQWSIKEETSDTICVDLPATRWPRPRNRLPSASSLS